MLIKDMPGINTKTVTALANKDIHTLEDIVRCFPRKYLDYRNIVGANEAVGKNCAISGYVEAVVKDTNNRASLLSMDVIDNETGEKVHVKWFGQIHLWERIFALKNKEVVVCGNVTNHEKYGYGIMNPYDFCAKESYHGRIVPVYMKMKGISEDMHKKLLKQAIEMLEEPLEKEAYELVKKYKLLPYRNAIYGIHHPKTMEDVEEGKKRVIFNDLLYFALRLKGISTGGETSSVIVKDTTFTEQVINSLPFTLTKDQKETYESIKEEMQAGRRVNSLVQGDVSCGKTMVAFLTMLLMADNGYQSVLMAPTQVLAGQHYRAFCDYVIPMGLKVAYLSGDLKGKEKQKVLEGIKSGDYQFVIGTHSAFSKNVEYQNLGLVITDEEHRFGVLQREALNEKAKDTAHFITMSATPIPRSIAETIYGEGKGVYEIKTMPGERKPIQTAINSSEKVIFDFVEKQLKEGRQCYVICPAVEAKESEDENTLEIESVEETVEKYKERFEPLGFKVGMAVGGNNTKANNADTSKALDAFVNNEIQILVATTVVEVGVNVPNASVIVINNAERFGLAQLHQLRGRVGRGSYKSYCILKSKFKDNERLNVMVETLDGFKIAERDLELRGAGDILGEAQTGKNKYIELVMSNPALFKSIRKIANWVNQIGQGRELVSRYEESELAVA